MNDAEYQAFLGECHIDWDGVDVIAKITHVPTGIFIEPKVQDTGQRRELFDELAAKVKAG